MIYAEGIWLGDGPLDAPEHDITSFESRIAEGLRIEPLRRISGGTPPSLEVSATSPTHIRTIDLTLDHSEFDRTELQALMDTELEPDERKVSTREQARIDHASITASPVTLSGAPVDLQVNASNIRTTLLTDTESGVWLHIPAKQSSAFTMDLQLSATQEDLTEVVALIAGSQLAASGVKLSDLRLTVEVEDTERGHQLITVKLAGKVKKAIFAAGLTAVVSATLNTKRMTATIEEVSLKSLNPIVALLPKLAGKLFKQQRGKVVKLNRHLPGNLAFTNVVLDETDGRLMVQASFGVPQREK